jgi:hypothetical protein
MRRTDIFPTQYMYVSYMTVTISSYFVPEHLKPLVVVMYRSMFSVRYKLSLLAYIYKYIYKMTFMRDVATNRLYIYLIIRLIPVLF